MVALMQQCNACRQAIQQPNFDVPLTLRLKFPHVVAALYLEDEKDEQLVITPDIYNISANLVLDSQSSKLPAAMEREKKDWGRITEKKKDMCRDWYTSEW